MHAKWSTDVSTGRQMEHRRVNRTPNEAHADTKCTPNEAHADTKCTPNGALNANQTPNGVLNANQTPNTALYCSLLLPYYPILLPATPYRTPLSTSLSGYTPAVHPLTTRPDVDARCTGCLKATLWAQGLRVIFEERVKVARSESYCHV